MKDVIQAFNESIRTLSRGEARSIKELFPDAEINSMRFINDPFMKFESHEDLCSSKGVKKDGFQCTNKPNKEVKVYSADFSRYLDVIHADELIGDICSMYAKYGCTPKYLFEARYNCIGLAVGIIAWVDASNVNKDNLFGIELIISSFLQMQNKDAPPDRITNLFKILDRLVFVEDIPVPPKNNTVAFYFDGITCKHAARYISDFDAWVSKLGDWIVVTHKLGDLIGDTYGDTIYYASIEDKIIGTTTDNNDEL